MGLGRGYFEASPSRASSDNSAPPGYGKPKILAVLSKASPAASSRVSPNK